MNKPTKQVTFHPNPYHCIRIRQHDSEGGKNGYYDESVKTIAAAKRVARRLGYKYREHGDC
ncbi:MAG: hypothetical protein OXC95_11555 [Dehalococcoidia bacterium]|nr:hypothetical protein [Dehalococcoidia bacterium]